MNYGSVCSGIEAASVAFEKFKFQPLWFSEIAEFPSRVLKFHYPSIKNLGDMNHIAELIRGNVVDAPDILCGGTPCQAFSLAGWKKGLVDKRGQLTLSFIEIADAVDEKRLAEKKAKTIVLWENVEGVLRDKTNAFGIFLSGLAGLDEEIKIEKWPSAGILYGKLRNVVWRVLDAKYFGLPQQRRRLFVIATGKDRNPDMILFEKTKYNNDLFNFKSIYTESVLANNDNEISLCGDFFEDKPILEKIINNNNYEVFREYTDCLYSAYGTKWNGNAAAYNGSLYISENKKVRRLTPLECERLMGFPDNYTDIPGNKDTNRYQAVGNSWAVPVITWIGKKISENHTFLKDKNELYNTSIKIQNKYDLVLLNDDFTHIGSEMFINTSPCPNDFNKGDIFEIIDTSAPEKFYLSSKGTAGILRRKNERSLNMNNRLEELFLLNVDQKIV